MSYHEIGLLFLEDPWKVLWGVAGVVEQCHPMYKHWGLCYTSCRTNWDFSQLRELRLTRFVSRHYRYNLDRKEDMTKLFVIGNRWCSPWDFNARSGVEICRKSGNHNCKVLIVTYLPPFASPLHMTRKLRTASCFDEKSRAYSNLSVIGPQTLKACWSIELK